MKHPICTAKEGNHLPKQRLSDEIASEEAQLRLSARTDSFHSTIEQELADIEEGIFCREELLLASELPRPKKRLDANLASTPGC